MKEYVKTAESKGICKLMIGVYGGPAFSAISGATVRIFDKSNLQAEGITDDEGMTIPLPITITAPNRYFDVIIFCEGYKTNIILGLPAVADVTVIRQVELIQ